MEIWIDIKGFEGAYQISNLGSVRSLDRVVTDKNGNLKTVKGRMLSLINHTGGYLTTKIGKAGNRYIHRLVAEAFLIKPEGKTEVNHIDGNKKNNTVENLEWVTPSENQLHSKATGIAPTGENHPQAKLSNEDVQYIIDNYKPFDQVFSGKALGEKLGVAKSVICRIANGTRRKHG